MVVCGVQGFLMTTLHLRRLLVSSTLSEKRRTTLVSALFSLALMKKLVSQVLFLLMRRSQSGGRSKKLMVRSKMLMSSMVDAPQFSMISPLLMSTALMKQRFLLTHS